MNRKIICIVLCLSLCGLCACSSGKEKNSPKASTGVNVTVFDVKKSNIESTVVYTGNLVAAESVNVSAKVSAKAQSVRVSEGDYVTSGEVLLSLDPTDLNLSYQQSVAAYESALASYDAVVNSSSKQQVAQAEQAQASAQVAYEQAKINFEREKVLFENASQVKIAEQTYNDAKANYERMKQLFDMGGATKLELDSAMTSLVSAEENFKTAKATASASYDNAKATLNSAEIALGNATQNVALAQNAAEASVKTAQASVNSAKAAMDIAENSLKSTSVTAPISGYISLCNVSAGQMVTAGSPLFEISNTNIIDAEVQVTESVIPLIDVGTKAVISVESAGVIDLEGAVTSLNPVKNEATGLYTIKVSIDNSDSIVNAGMLADISLTTASLDNIIKIPSEALINEGDDYYVYVAKEKTAEKKKVVIGVSDENYTEILSGIGEAEMVIVDGKEYLSEKNNEINITGNYKI